MEDLKTSLYILTYNSPDQVRSILKSFEKVDKNFLIKPRKILIDNSTDLSTAGEYFNICRQYDLEIIKKDNIGIASGRQFVAEHFDESDSDYYIFFEDDMHLNSEKTVCRKGFNTYIDDLYEKSLSIIHSEHLDFLKLTYSEFFGDNSNQWAWYNIPQDVREKFFPNNHQLPEQFGDDHVMPKIIPTARKKYKDLVYLLGNYYFCNWPLWFSKKGNYTLFLDTVWRYPYEQTIMSQNFQLQMEGRMKCGVLELSPIHHERFDHYPAEERREVAA
jgi:hypothetical protein